MTVLNIVAMKLHKIQPKNQLQISPIKNDDACCNMYCKILQVGWAVLQCIALHLVAVLAICIARWTVLQGDARRTALQCALQYGRSTCNTILQTLQYTLQHSRDRESCNTGHTVITILYCNKTTRKVRLVLR